MLLWVLATSVARGIIDCGRWCRPTEGWRLADLLAVAATELLAHRLNHLGPARDLLQRLGHLLVQLRQPRSAAAGAGGGWLDDYALELDVGRPWLTHRPFARDGTHGLGFRRRGGRGKLVLARRRHEVFELQFQLLDPPRRALGALPYSSRFSFSMRSLRCAIRASVSDSMACALAASACQLETSVCATSRSASTRTCFAFNPVSRFRHGRQRGTRLMRLSKASIF